MNKIFLVRHGQCTDNAAGILNGRRDTELTELGREQAKLAAEKLCDKNVSIIYASPLRRTFETAKIISEVLGIDEVVTHDSLLEREFGFMTGKPVADIPKLVEKVLVTEKVNYFLEADGAEDFPSLMERCRKLLAEINQLHLDKNMLLVTHGDTGKIIRAAYYGWSWEEGLKMPYFDNTEILELNR